MKFGKAIKLEASKFRDMRGATTVILWNCDRFSHGRDEDKEGDRANNVGGVRLKSFLV